MMMTLNEFDAKKVGGVWRADAVHQQCVLFVGRHLELDGGRRRTTATKHIRQLDDRLLAGEHHRQHGGRVGTVGERRCPVSVHQRVTLRQVDQVQLNTVGAIDHLHRHSLIYTLRAFHWEFLGSYY